MGILISFIINNMDKTNFNNEFDSISNKVKGMFILNNYSIRKKIKNRDFNGIENWDVSGVTDMSKIFENFTEGIEMNISNWDVSNVTNMSRMFRGS